MILRVAPAALALAAAALLPPPPAIAQQAPAEVPPAREAPAAAGDMEARIAAIIPALEAYVEKGMADFDVPGAAVGLVAGDRLVYAKGFGLRAREGEPVDPGTVFQIGSTTKAFLATTIAIAVDRADLAWDDRVVDRHPGFRLKDPWVTGEFRIFDLLAQRSGLPPYANDVVGLLGFDMDQMIHSLRNVTPVSSFRSTFAYTNITHMVAQEIVADVMGAEDWESVVEAEIFAPLAMTSSSFTAAAIEAEANASRGHLWTPEGAVEVPFNEIFPYGFGGAGAINSNIEDMSRWVRLQLGEGTFEGHEIVTAANLDVTRVPRVGIAPNVAYAMGWVDQSTPNGRLVWHNGGTTAFGAFVGLLPDRDAGIVILTNATNVGLPDAIGAWIADRLLGNPERDYAAERLEGARKQAETEHAAFAPPADAGPAPDLAPLAGAWENPTFGTATLAPGADGFSLTIDATGARLPLAAWDGYVFTLGLAREGAFSGIASNLGEDPIGFAEFQVDAAGRRNLLNLTMAEDGTTFLFTRKAP